MPIPKSNRPSPFFAQQRRGVAPTITQPQPEKPQSQEDLLRFYPLESTNKAASAARGAMPVNPLQHQNRQPGFSMAPPVMARPNQVPAAPPPPSQPSSPEMAAQQFRKANRGLPDGVRYEPLDEQTMQLLRENGHLPEAPAATQQRLMPVAQSSSPPPHISPIVPTHSPPPHMPPITPVHSLPQPVPPLISQNNQQSIEIIQGLIQDERNAYIFYSHLARESQSQGTAEALVQIAKDSQRHTEVLSESLIVHFKDNFTPEEAEINTGLELNTALELALTEEGKTLRVLTELLGTINVPEIEKRIQRIINNKIINYSQLVRFSFGADS